MAGEVQVPVHVAVHQRRAFRQRVFERDDRRQRLDVRRDTLRRVGRLIPGRGDDGGHHLAHEADAVAGEDGPRRRDGAGRGQVDRQRPARALEVRGHDAALDCPDSPTRHRAAHEGDVHAALGPQVVDEPSLTPQQPRVLEPPEAPANRP